MKTWIFADKENEGKVRVALGSKLLFGVVIDEFGTFYGVVDSADLKTKPSNTHQLMKRFAEKTGIRKIIKVFCPTEFEVFYMGDRRGLSISQKIGISREGDKETDDSISRSMALLENLAMGADSRKGSAPVQRRI